MWRRPLVARAGLLPRRCHSVCSFVTAVGGEEPADRPWKLYVVAGEASGDAIGAKVIRALQRQQPARLLFRGIGGPQMCAAGEFSSLFPMQELSVMGLVEVLPSLWRFRRRLQDTLRDIEAFQPDLVLTIDSKGFTFRVLKALQAKESDERSDLACKRVKKVHYVAPSVWAYKHRNQRRDFTQLEQLLDAMFVILPFEEDIFLASSATPEAEKKKWCHFVGHPAVEDFLELHKLYGNDCERERPVQVSMPVFTDPQKLEVSSNALLDASKLDLKALALRGEQLQSVAERARSLSARAVTREKMGVPTDALIICALLGSRANEVDKSARLVLDAIERLQESSPGRKICVIFPTISAVEAQVKTLVASNVSSVDCHVLSDLKASARLELFQSCDLAVAVSGTIVLETTLANLPTVVIYRANRVTEWIVQRLAAVRFVSVPNLLLGRPLIPELLFRECSSLKIAEALRELEQHPRSKDDELQLAMAASTLTKWEVPGYPHSSVGEEAGTEPKPASTLLRPIRASDLVAKHLLHLLKDK